MYSNLLSSCRIDQILTITQKKKRCNPAYMRSSQKHVGDGLSPYNVMFPVPTSQVNPLTPWLGTQPALKGAHT